MAKTPNPKLQIPNKFQTSSSNLRGAADRPKHESPAGVWDLELGASLEFGTWSLELPVIHFVFMRPTCHAPHERKMNPG
jgi:hypothetical protein